MEKKNFDEWNTIKKRMHAASNMPRIKEGEVYWCGCGENVGVEINGKNELFSRPVLILKKTEQVRFSRGAFDIEVALWNVVCIV